MFSHECMSWVFTRLSELIYSLVYELSSHSVIWANVFTWVHELSFHSVIWAHLIMGAWAEFSLGYLSSSNQNVSLHWDIECMSWVGFKCPLGYLSSSNQIAFLSIGYWVYLHLNIGCMSWVGVSTHLVIWAHPSIFEFPSLGFWVYELSVCKYPLGYLSSSKQSGFLSLGYWVYELTWSCVLPLTNKILKECI